MKEKSGGLLELQCFYGGSKGDEVATVDLMKSGQLDGVAVSSVGLARLHKPALALQMPGLFTTWAKLDAARDALAGELETGLRNAGAGLVGWYDVGMVSVLSRGFPVRAPANLKGKKPWLWRDDPVVKAFYQRIGGVTPVSRSVLEVLPRLSTSAVDAVLQSPLAVEQLQWASKLDTITDLVVGPGVGAIVLAQKRLDALPGDLRSVVLDTGKIAAAALKNRIRTEDAAALARLKTKMTVVSLTAEERGWWNARFKETRQLLAQGTFSPVLVARLESMA
ncbi:TRAP-type C4-dicarboxylate transport system, substrate-binding protein [Nannocystis exedens]|uniref:TRAP-type C4-dicarboxylate transport system, substrate-binding protein n=1 Tax=Nannocystis exedens TaxID=54 RepID=A0A1I2CUN4_9BACT|nr:2,3-diketo-L-gulonate-binding periplasmic protein YiaO precursor [Nannocystis exedens]SFE71895.1 TRAP-type C4-dicarboxylate transport system, substrate-binding protein [Nannocystis exedens]